MCNCNGSATLLSVFPLICFQELFENKEEEFGRAVSAQPAPPCFGARRSPDVVVCNLCHVLVGKRGCCSPPFTSVIYSGGSECHLAL